MQETYELCIQSLGQEDTLEQRMATHSSIVAMHRGAWWATVHGVAKSWTRLSMHTYISLFTSTMT